MDAASIVIEPNTFNITAPAGMIGTVGGAGTTPFTSRL